MKPRVPFGFWVAGAFSAWLCLAMVVIVGVSDTLWHGEWVVLIRAVAMLLAVLSAVATEALWRARPWVWRASLTLVVAYAVAVLVAFGADPMSSIVDGVAVLLVSATVAVPLLAHIHRRAKVMWPKPPPQPAPPAAVPRPAPPMHPAQRPGGRP
jgi:peptidoglycan/LPS O-acetylase OafA/YrhL